MTVPMTPLVSFCIPTFNRCRYLESLLESLLGQLADFPFPFELVIADNASPDGTQSVIETYLNRLPIRYLRHDANIGGYPNWQFVMSKALGRYLVYLSDDDCLLGDQVAAAISKMEADPEIAVVYAPWMFYDLVAQQEQGQFYTVPRDLRIERGHHRDLLDNILRHHIFPEIQITRRDAFEATMPRINDHAFLAFMHAADYLTQGAVLIQQQPFYVAITRYFDDDTREQLGTDEVEHAWDRYRGGLEYLLARTGTPISVEERQGFHLRIQQMIAIRMSVAIRLRHQKNRNPIDNYYLAMRLRGMGYEQLLPVSLETLASEAVAFFVTNDPELNRGIRRVIFVGSTPGGVREYLAQHCQMPVEFLDDMRSCDHLYDSLVFIRDDAPAAQQLDSAIAAQRNVRVLHERNLMSKFGL